MSQTLAVVETAAALPTVFAAVDPVAYTPATFAADILAASGTILPYVGAGVAGGLALMFAFMGIRKGIAFFRGTSK